MKYICLSNLSEYPEDFLFAKVDVEKYRIENGELSERQKLEDFILSLNLQNYIYMLGNKSISFSIQKGLNEKYVFYDSLDPDKDGKLFESFKEKLSVLKYSFKSLNKIKNIDLLNIDTDKVAIFIINQELYV